METNDIVDGVSIKLNKIEETFEIYTNNVKQGLEMPCFFIKLLPSSKKQLIGNRYENTINLAIHVMLEDSEDKQERLNHISDNLYELEYITLLNKDILKGYDMKTEESDGVLLFFITYKYFTYKNKENDTKMEELTVSGEVNNE